MKNNFTLENSTKYAYLFFALLVPLFAIISIYIVVSKVENSNANIKNLILEKDFKIIKSNLSFNLDYYSNSIKSIALLMKAKDDLSLIDEVLDQLKLRGNFDDVSFYSRLSNKGVMISYLKNTSVPKSDLLSYVKNKKDYSRAFPLMFSSSSSKINNIKDIGSVPGLDFSKSSELGDIINCLLPEEHLTETCRFIITGDPMFFNYKDSKNKYSNKISVILPVKFSNDNLFKGVDSGFLVGSISSLAFNQRLFAGATRSDYSVLFGTEKHLISASDLKNNLKIKEKNGDVVLSDYNINVPLETFYYLIIFIFIQAILSIVKVYVFNINNKKMSKQGALLDETQSLKKKLKKESLTDALTNIGNRALFNQELSRLVKKKSPFGVMFLDLDGFKQINDTLGHDVGDDLLIRVADILVEVVNNAGSVFRLGGDEFTILIHKDSDYLYFAEEIVKKVGVTQELNGVSVKASCSLGFSIFPEQGETDKDILKIADEHMYIAKNSGKNQFYPKMI